METADETVAFIRWVSLKRDEPTNAVAPGTPVTVEVEPGLGIAPTYAEVHRHLGPIFKQLAARLFRSPIVGSVSLQRVGRHQMGGWWRYEPYMAEHLPPPELQTRYVGSAGGKRTAHLYVGSPAIIDTEATWGGKAGVGLDIPLAQVGLDQRRTKRRNIRITAPADPDLRLDILTEQRSVADTELGALFGSYVEKMFPLLDTEIANVLGPVYYEEFLPAYLRTGGEVAAVGLDETSLHLDAGEVSEVSLTFEPKHAGTMGLAVVATDVETGEFTVSDLMGVSVDADGGIAQDF